MCDTKFSIYLYSVRFGIRAGGHVSLRFSVVGVFKHVFGIGFISRRVTKFACNFLSLLAYILQSLYALFEVFNFCFFFYIWTNFINFACNFLSLRTCFKIC